MDHEKCFVFEPEDEHPTKKRRIGSDDWINTWKLRKELYEQFWAHQRSKIESVLNRANEETVTKVLGFITSSKAPESSKLPAGLISAGPNIASHGALFRQIATKLGAADATIFVALTSSECSNLKSLLKSLIVKGTTLGDDEEDDAQTPHRKGPKLLNYDLQLLHDHVKQNAIETVVITFQDTEAFDGHVLSETIELFGLWRNRIPFVILFGIATSTDAFQDRLSRSALRCLQGKEFDVVQTDDLFEQVFLTTIDGNERHLWIGPELMSTFLNRQKDHAQNVTEFIDALKYAHMCHFFANSVSILMSTEAHGKVEISRHLCYTLRHLPSFEVCVSSSLNANNTFRESRGFLVPRPDRPPLSMRHYLFDDVALERLLNDTMVYRDTHSFPDMVRALRMIRVILSKMPRYAHHKLSALYTMMIGGNLLDSPMVKEMIAFLKRAPSNVLLEILNDTIGLLVLHQVEDAYYFETRDELQKLINDAKATDAPLRSAFDERNETLRTTVIAKKVELSKQKATLSKNDEAYSQILQRFTARLDEWLVMTLFYPDELMFAEVFIYDIKSPYRAAFSPKTRFAVERALSSPRDYLEYEYDCYDLSEEECEKQEARDAALSAAAPATAIMYQLYLESGALMNASDLYSAYHAILEEKTDDEELIKALFQRSLAELKYMGFIKDTKKKVDHVAKAAWSGL
ncbi:hypothetical protein NA57DRAFT_38384 [Rhizodiscina lignyota]|uniref:Origin recognition complex subunit n=1 Tax=Rhizodiscina lignyota TaxID=1504668 RepID=A0A9P4M6M4_9PEZI|nr:hypothetical protein NA57DRAFT_38384 [Rhizodiscina lignyota]